LVLLFITRGAASMRVELLIFVYSAAAIFAASACFMALVCAFWGAPTPLLPPRRHRLVSWGGGEVLVAFAALLLLLPMVFEMSLESSGMFRWLYNFTGGDFQADFGGDSEKVFRHLPIWEAFPGFPAKLIVLWAILKSTRFFHPYQLGLSTHRIWQMVGLGWVVWLICGLPCDLLHMLLTHTYTALLPQEQEVHAIFKIAQEHPPLVEWGLLITSAVFIAPFMEELMFRGLLQRWLVNRPTGINVTLAFTLALAFLFRTTKIGLAMKEQSWAAWADAFAPIFFVLLTAGAIYALTSMVSDRRIATKWQAILTASLLFAIAHANVWPSPLALFALAICLGWVLERTQSLIPCIVAHSLFNAVACVQLVLGLVQDQLPYCSG
jgi:membrane protease YdiL (CAAX protease family)